MGFRDPVHGFRLSKDFSISEFLRVKSGIPSGFQYRVAVDGDCVGLEQTCHRVGIIDGDRTSGKGIHTRFQLVIIPHKIHTGSRGDIQIPIRAYMRIGFELHRVGRIEFHFRHSQCNGTRSIGLSIDLGDSGSRSPGGYIDRPDAAQFRKLSNVDSRYIVLRINPAVGARPRQRTSGLKTDFILRHNIIQSTQRECTGTGGIPHNIQLGMISHHHLRVEIDNRLTDHTRATHQTSGGPIDVIRRAAVSAVI